jgi:hypothetical protein
MAGSLDNTYGAPVPPDQQPTPAKAAAAASKKTSDTFVIERSGLNVVANGVYAFSFAYEYADPSNPSNYLLSPPSANFRFTLEAPDYTVAVQNLTVTPGSLSYIAKWDPIDKSLAANKWFIDAQIYESKTGLFTGEEYLVWNGTGNTATILVSDLNNRWIKVDTRDQDYHKKSVIRGPFKATDPIVVDTTGPDNVGSVTTAVSLDSDGIIGFNGNATIGWAPVTGNGIRGYRIRWRQVATPETAYSYVDSPGTGTSYRLSGLGVGLTYEFAVATYDEYNNTSSQYISGVSRTVTGTPYIAGTVDVSGFFRAKANSTDLDSTAFKFGYGVDTGKRGLVFNANNYWYIDSAQSASLKVGGSLSNFISWNGTKFTVDGDITARGGTFSGNILMSTTGASIYSGTINTAGNLTGNGFALNSTGLKVANGLNSVTLDAATGTITANAGTIAGWTMSGTTLSKNNVILDSAGKIQVGATAAASVYIQSASGTSPTKTYVMWAGNNTPDANAKFKVGADGVLHATGAIFGSGTTVAGYATSTELGTTNTNVTNLGTTVTNQGTAITNKLTKSASVITSATNEIQGLNAMGITMFSNNNASASAIPTSGARVVMNSRGIAAYDGTSTTNDTGVTFSLNGTNGSAFFKGEIQASSGTFSGALNAATGTFKGNVELVGSSWISTAGVLITDTDLFGSAQRSALYAGNLTLSSGGTSSFVIAASGAGGEAQGSLLLGSNSQIHLYGVNSSSGTIYANRTVLLGQGHTQTLSFNAGGLTKIFTDGAIFANTLNAGAGTTSGTNIVQNSSGYLKVLGSSRRFKENIIEIPQSGYLDAFLKINPVNFTYKNNDQNVVEPVQSGLIAEELDLIPEFKGVVNYDEEGLPLSISYDRISALLVLAIKEINERLDALER